MPCRIKRDTAEPKRKTFSLPTSARGEGAVRQAVLSIERLAVAHEVDVMVHWLVSRCSVGIPCRLSAVKRVPTDIANGDERARALRQFCCQFLDVGP